MAKGLKIPVGVDQRGRAAVETDESQNTKKILTLAFSEGDDDNAFQSLGLTSTLVFGVKGAAFRGRAIRVVTTILAKFTEIVELDDSEPITFQEDIEGEVEMSFFYIDLLTNRKEEFTKRLTRSLNR